MSKSSLLILGRGDNDYSDRNGKCLFEYAQNASLDVQFADYHNIGKLVDFVNENLKEITNFSQGATILHNPETGLEPIYVEFLKKQAKKAAQVMGSRFLGVDIMFDGESPTDGKVVEVQTFTDFPRIEKFNLAQYILTHLERQ